MKNKELWKPTKFIRTPNGLRAIRDGEYAGKGQSIFMGDILAKYYEKMISAHAKGTMLDLGCGNVPLYCVYSSLVDKIICVDWSNSYFKNSHIDIECNLNDILPLSTESFDTIIITDVLEHINNPFLLWSEMSRILKPKGKLLIGIPFLFNLHDEPYDYFRYTEFAIKMFCENNSLQILSIDSMGGSPEVIINIIAKHLSFSRALTYVNRVVGKMIMSLKIAKRISHKTQHKFPLGYCIVAQKNQSKAGIIL